MRSDEGGAKGYQNTGVGKGEGVRSGAGDGGGGRGVRGSIQDVEIKCCKKANTLRGENDGNLEFAFYYVVFVYFDAEKFELRRAW